MDESDWLAKRFQQNRPHLQKVAFRMLGSPDEANDAVQEAWIRLSQTDAGRIENLGGWLTTVVARVCLDMLRSRKARREAPLAEHTLEPMVSRNQRSDAESDLLLADSVGPALLVVLETLAPAERVAFVLHDMFDLPFDEIATIVGRSEAATRQLASRARRRVRGTDSVPSADLARRRELVSAFLAASRDGDFEGLLATLAPEAVLRADDLSVQTAAANRWGGAPSLSSERRGARAVAETFKGRARGAQLALINGDAGAVWAVRGQARAAFVFTIEHGKIVEIDLVMSPERLAELDVEILGS
ncbi:MAG TPA: sigma-70 family RNA polymerase sigma factor [Polyangia bacterium]|nr:sigma-70 family RNA polymerase sigma factor [Polyangia bacterium]